MAEFKKLSEVEQIETASDNATVLIEEDGEIKRVPKKEVGGAGGYIAILTEEDFNNPVVEWEGGLVISANYDELYEVLCAGGSAWIDITAMINSSAPSALAASGSAVSPTVQEKMRASIILWAITDIGLLTMTNDMQVLFPNGSHNLDPVISDR